MMQAVSALEPDVSIDRPSHFDSKPTTFCVLLGRFWISAEIQFTTFGALHVRD
jgi:hypothetical protein